MKLKIFCLIVCSACLITSCKTTADIPDVPKIIAATPAGKVGEDLHTAVAQATQAYVDAKHGDTGWAWSAAEAIKAVQLAQATAADVKLALQTWNDGTKAGKTFAEKIASLFSSSSGTPQSKAATAAAAVQEVAADKGP